MKNLILLIVLTIPLISFSQSKNSALEEGETLYLEIEGQGLFSEGEIKLDWIDKITRLVVSKDDTNENLEEVSGFQVVCVPKQQDPFFRGIRNSGIFPSDMKVEIKKRPSKLFFEGVTYKGKKIQGISFSLK